MAFFFYLLLLKTFAEKRPQRWLWIAILVLTFINIFFINDGRTGYFIFACLTAIFFLQKTNWSWKGWLMAIASVIFLLGLAAGASHTFQSRLNEVSSDVKSYQNKNEDTSFGARMAFVKNTIPIIKQHIIFGGGTGSFQPEYANLKPRPASFTRNPHNEYLHVMAQFGIIGLLLLLFIFYSQLRLSRYLPNQLGWIAQAVIITVMIGSLVNSLLLDSAEGHFYVYFIALTFAALPQECWWKKRYFI
jgi:O-antigen ligase